MKKLSDPLSEITHINTILENIQFLNCLFYIFKYYSQLKSTHLSLI